MARLSWPIGSASTLCRAFVCDVVFVISVVRIDEFSPNFCRSWMKLNDYVLSSSQHDRTGRGIEIRNFDD